VIKELSNEMKSGNKESELKTSPSLTKLIESLNRSAVPQGGAAPDGQLAQINEQVTF